MRKSIYERSDPWNSDVLSLVVLLFNKKPWFFYFGGFEGVNGKDPRN
jgi:hypothetical protein